MGWRRNKEHKKDKTDYKTQAHKILSIIRDESDKYPWNQREKRTRFVAREMIKKLCNDDDVSRKEAKALWCLCNELFPDYVKDCKPD